MGKTAEYGIDGNTFPRGWFVIAESSELNTGPKAVRFFGKDFALYRGESGNPVLLDAYCKHMGTHLTANTTAAIVTSGTQIEGDSIRCPYHGWRYAADGQVDDIPYHDGPCPKSAALTSYPVRDIMGCILAWHDPDNAEPTFEPPFLELWDDPAAVRWELDHLGELELHNIEILDNMADLRHLGPTHGSPCEYFENEIRDHVLIQRQGGFLDLYQAHLYSVTWYTGPGILLSKQNFGEVTMFELIASTPVDDGLTKVWHGVLLKGQNVPPSAEDIEAAKGAQAGALQAFSADFEIWRNKKSALKIMQVKTDGPFRTVRKWASQFYAQQENVQAIRDEVNGMHPVLNFPQPGPDRKTPEFEEDCFKSA